MIIESLYYHIIKEELKIDAKFFPDLTLLVGQSGVGKTQILTALTNLKAIAREKGIINGLEWQIIFRTKSGKKYHWNGKSENKEIDYDMFSGIHNFLESEENLPRIVEEKLSSDDRILIDRNETVIMYKGAPTPKLSPYESVLRLLSQEEDIGVAAHEFKKILSSDNSDISRGRRLGNVKFDEKVHQHQTLESIQESNIDAVLKLALVYKNVKDTFEEIKNDFIDIFDQVEDIKFVEAKCEIPPFFLKSDYPLMKIKEKGVDNWIPIHKISSGMLRTILHISEKYLYPEGTVILVDEFENSLGVNCIDVLTDSIIRESRGHQLIVTSHHPYIINSISMNNWKIVIRENGIVKTYNIDHFKLPKSNHQAFLQLMNLMKGDVATSSNN